MYNGVIFNDGDPIDGNDKLGLMIKNDQWMKGIADGTPRGYLGSGSCFGTAVASNVAETTLITINLWIPEVRTVKGMITISSGQQYIDTTGNNNLKLRVYEDSTQRNEFWQKLQIATGGAGDLVVEPDMYCKFLLPTISAGNHTIYLKGILNTASPTGFNVYASMTLCDAGMQMAAS